MNHSSLFFTNFSCIFYHSKPLDEISDKIVLSNKLFPMTILSLVLYISLINWFNSNNAANIRVYWFRPFCVCVLKIANSQGYI